MYYMCIHVCIYRWYLYIKTINIVQYTPFVKQCGMPRWSCVVTPMEGSSNGCPALVSWVSFISIFLAVVSVYILLLLAVVSVYIYIYIYYSCFHVYCSVARLPDFMFYYTIYAYICMANLCIYAWLITACI